MTLNGTIFSDPAFLALQDFGTHIYGRLEELWEETARRAKVYKRGRGFHCLRHFHATEFYAKTRDLRATQQRLGHTSPHITQNYADVVDMREKVQEVGVVIAGSPWQGFSKKTGR